MKQLLIAALVAATTQAGWSGRTQPSALENAHQAALEGRYKDVALALKTVFQQPNLSQTEKQNALSLLGKVYQSVDKLGLPTDWKLPPEITKMSVQVDHRIRNGEVSYDFKIGGDVVQRGIIRQLQVIQHPDRVVLDKRAGIGKYEEADEEDGPYYEIQSDKSTTPMDEGLYYLNIELANGSVTHGYFIITDMVSSTVPVVMTPANGQVFSVARPTMHFQNFVSPEYKENETRALWMAIVRNEPPKYEWEKLESYYEGNPTRTQYTVDRPLDNGRYLFYLTYRESHKFGDLRMDRRATASVPFFIKK